MIFGNEILNAKQLAEKLGISRNYLLKMVNNGLPYHQLGKKSRKYYIFDEVKDWLKKDWK